MAVAVRHSLNEVVFGEAKVARNVDDAFQFVGTSQCLDDTWI